MFMKRKPDNSLKQVARERVQILLENASKVFAKSPELAHRYVYLARKIAMKARYKMESSFKRRFCKHCYHYLSPGKNARIRTREGKLIIYCLDCKKYSRIPLN